MSPSVLLIYRPGAGLQLPSVVGECQRAHVRVRLSVSLSLCLSVAGRGGRLRCECLRAELFVPGDPSGKRESPTLNPRLEPFLLWQAADTR